MSESQVRKMFDAAHTGDADGNGKPAPTFHVPTSTETATEKIHDPYAQDIKDLHDRMDKIEHQIAMGKDTTAINQRELSNATTQDLSRTEKTILIAIFFIFAAIFFER